MKIAFLNIYQGKAERGAERVIIELSERLGKENQIKVFDGSIILPKRWPFLWRFFIDPQGLLIFWWTLKKLPEIWRERYDIVIPTNGGWQPALVRLLTWIYGGKMVIIGHSGIGWDEKNNLWSFPNVFVAPSSYSLSWAKKVNPFVKVKHIPNGVDVEEFKPGRVGVRKLKLKRPIILCVGALSPEKRHRLAISAVNRLDSGSLVIVGRGELESRLYNLGGRLLGKRFLIVSAGFDEMPGFYKAADVFVAPTSPWQSFEIVVLEAMATNVPVVVNDDPIRREIVGKAGIFVDPEDTDEFAEAIKKALKIDWDKKPREQAERFSWDKITKQYLKLFDNLVK